MTEEIIRNIVLTSIGVIVSSSVGYLVHKAKTYRDSLKNKMLNEEIQNVALRIILQKQLTDVYNKYQEKKEIPDYVYKNWLSLLKIYEQLDGDDYIHVLEKNMQSWKIIKTDVLEEN